MPLFPYGETEIAHLSRRDKKLGAAIARIGMIEREITPDPFLALIRSVIAQQISGKAARTVWGRLRENLPELTPARIAAMAPAEIQQCGMSMRKATYIQGIGAAVLDGSLEVEKFHSLPDEEIIRQVSALHGLGVWTAEMLLIFSLGRPDVVSWGDLAIRRGMCHLYGLRTLTKEQFARYRKRYAPYGSVASFYLWTLSVE